MKRSERIHHILESVLKPERLDVVDESSRHAGHAGASAAGETHYRVEIVAAVFRDKSRVARERLVHELLADEFSQGLHALSVRASAPNENR